MNERKRTWVLSVKGARALSHLVILPFRGRGHENIREQFRNGRSRATRRPGDQTDLENYICQRRANYGQFVRRTLAALKRASTELRERWMGVSRIRKTLIKAAR